MKAHEQSDMMLLWEKELVGAFKENGYIYECKVSSGGFGTIYKCNKGKYKYAVKFQYKDIEGHSLQKELQVMKAIHASTSDGSKFLLKPILGVRRLLSQASILTAYYGRTLTVSIERWKGDNTKIKRLAIGLCKGILHIHKSGFAHRDLKVSNILLQNGEGDPVIIDFGLANAKHRGAGTPGYTAPEQTGGVGVHKDSEWWILEGWDQRVFDSWALGIVITKCFRGHHVSEQAQNFIGHLLNVNPGQRFSV